MGIIHKVFPHIPAKDVFVFTSLALLVLKGQSRIDWAEDRKNVVEEIALCHVKVHLTTFSKAKNKRDFPRILLFLL